MELSTPGISGIPTQATSCGAFDNVGPFEAADYKCSVTSTMVFCGDWGPVRWQTCTKCIVSKRDVGNSEMIVAQFCVRLIALAV